ncbi:MAG: pSer/pThr/pTyr-binding forkhead associated (FHA) protein [Flavobacteriales bacterium]|jgi:pSer/pThr/pTyr-binding forkhead associated (FHA) protein
MPVLTHSLNGHTLTLFEVESSLRIGRKTDCEISLDDPTVSAEHAHILCKDGEWSVVDAQSTNGIRVDGEKVDSSLLTEGSILSIGAHQFEFSNSISSNLDKTLKIKKSWIPGVYYTE